MNGSGERKTAEVSHFAVLEDRTAVNCVTGFCQLILQNSRPSLGCGMPSLLEPAPPVDRISIERVDPTYRRLRWQVFIGIFVGYAAYYLVRKNFALAMP